MESKKKRQARQKANREISTMLGLITAGMFSVLAIGAGKYMKQMDVTARENNRQSVVIKKKQSVLFFYRDDCGDCQKIFEQVYNLSQKNPGKVQFINTNNKKNHEKYLTKYSVKYVPTFIALDENGEEVSRYTGTDSEKIAEQLKKAGAKN